ncbi:mobilome CxxCx(11)CxxC protein [Pantoea sp. Fr+CA_20]|uniref:mobilome CxxCx(11)CxxC protein n=1 Tax=Pantoea sp. Fr+CA_20 TaxID=2929506 RepID=UPI0021183C0B|nr:mobilome CxxCx(11)CxxC protein [Pantoea sp. Fr+CA_20]
MSDIAEIQRKLLNIEAEAFGTAKIFERRKNVLGLPRMLLTFFGIAVPLTVGSTALSFGLDSKVFPYLLSLLGFVSTIQIITALWSIISKWDDKYIFYNESQKENTSIYNEARKAKEDANEQNKKDSALKLKELQLKSENRERLDLDYSISDAEKRYATRARNLYYKVHCHVCQKIPKSMTPDNCDGCGNYKLYKSK